MNFFNVFSFIVNNSIEIKTFFIFAVPISFIVAWVLPEKYNGHSYSFFALMFLCSLCYSWYVGSFSEQLANQAKIDAQEKITEYYQAKIDLLK